MAAPVAEEGNAEGLDEAGGGKRSGQRQQSRAEGEQEDQYRPIKGGRKEEGLERQPLGHESIEGRQCRDRHAADQEEYCRPWHAMNQPPHLLHVSLMGRVQHRPRPHEQQPLEHGVIEGVIQGRHQRQGGKDGKVEGYEDH